MIRFSEPLHGVLHLQDAMGVCMTLLRGEREALLVDTGYGLEDVQAAVKKQSETAVRVILTHGHHDHVLGAGWFDETRMAAEDQEEFRLRTGTEQRKRVRLQAAEKGLTVPDGWMTADIPMPRPLVFDRKTGPFDSLRLDLGGMTAEIIRVPGHTRGSCVVYVPERELLLSGDNWNPCTWVWFPCSVGAGLWRENMRKLAEVCPFRHVLCSHQPILKTREDLTALVEGMTDEALRSAPAVNMGSDIDTHEARLPDGSQIFVFDRAKL